MHIYFDWIRHAFENAFAHIHDITERNWAVYHLCGEKDFVTLCLLSNYLSAGMERVTVLKLKWANLKLALFIVSPLFTVRKISSAQTYAQMHTTVSRYHNKITTYFASHVHFIISFYFALSFDFCQRVSTCLRKIYCRLVNILAACLQYVWYVIRCTSN